MLQRSYNLSFWKATVSEGARQVWEKVYSSPYNIPEYALLLVLSCGNKTNLKDADC